MTEQYTIEALQEFYDDLTHEDPQVHMMAHERWLAHQYEPLAWACETLKAQAAELKRVEQMHLTLCYELMDLASVRDNYVSGYEQSLEEGHKLVERVALVEKAYCDMQTERDEARAELEKHAKDVADFHAANNES